MKEEMEKILTKKPVDRHSFFQLKFFIIGKEPTTQAKMWRCIKELSVRKESLESLSDEINDNKDNLELLNLDLSECSNNKRGEIQKRKINRNIKHTKKQIQNLIAKKDFIEEESQFFIKMFNNLNKEEELKEFDDIDAQREYWNLKLGNQMEISGMLGIPPKFELIETILCLPDDLPIKQKMINTINDIYNRNQLMKDEKNLKVENEQSK